MKSFLFVVLLVMPCFGQNAQSPDYSKSGNDFLNLCSDAGHYKQVEYMCIAYVNGVEDGIRLNESRRGGTGIDLCMTEGVTREQMFDVVVKFIKEHPANRQLLTVGLVYLALRDAFPCPSGEPAGKK